MNTGAALDRNTIQGLFEMADGDESFVRDLLKTYVAQAAEQFDAIQAAVAAADARAAARAAHSLAGASLNVGALRVATICRRIEANPSPMTADIRELEGELVSVIAAPLVQV